MELLVHVLPGCVGGNYVGLIAQGKRVVESELPAGEHLRGGVYADHGHVENPEDVGPGRGDPVINALVEAVDDRGDGDYSGDADDDAEDRQAGAQLVLPERVERQLNRCAALAVGHNDSLHQLDSSSWWEADQWSGSPDRMIFSGLRPVGFAPRRPMRCRLFVAQRLDGVEVGGFPCRIDAEGKADPARDGEPDNHPCGRQGGGQANGQEVHNPGENRAQ